MRSSYSPPLEHLHQLHKNTYRNGGGGVMSRAGWLLLLLGLTSILLITLSTMYHSPNNVDPVGLFPPLMPSTSQQNLLPSAINHDKDDDDDGEEKDACDLSIGKWVRDTRGPAYTNGSCPALLESSKNCGKYGKDMDYVNWRWKPDRCELPRFQPEVFLSIVRGKKMAFVGDSVARNHVESLICLLSQVETPTNMYKDFEDRFRTWYFASHDFTLMVLWTRFLVVGTERVINGSASAIFDIHLDKIDANWADKLLGVNYVVISNGHWFFRKIYLYEYGNLIGCVFCSEPNLKDLGVTFAIRRVFKTALQFLSKCQECHDQLLTLLRTFSPAHFESGVWNNGGNCNRTRPLSEEEAYFGGIFWELRMVQVEEVGRVLKSKVVAGVKKRFGVLDVTRAMMMRADGHPGSHWDNKWMRGYNDCVHWCLPGPIDMWNDVFIAMLNRSQI